MCQRQPTGRKEEGMNEGMNEGMKEIGRDRRN